MPSKARQSGFRNTSLIADANLRKMVKQAGLPQDRTFDAPCCIKLSAVMLSSLLRPGIPLDFLRIFPCRLSGTKSASESLGGGILSMVVFHLPRLSHASNLKGSLFRHLFVPPRCMDLLQSLSDCRIFYWLASCGNGVASGAARIILIAIDSCRLIRLPDCAHSLALHRPFWMSHGACLIENLPRRSKAARGVV